MKVDPPLDSIGIEVRSARLSGTVHLLRLCQRLSEYRTHAFCHCVMDGAKYEQRVRIQSDFVTFKVSFCGFSNGVCW